MKKYIITGIACAVALMAATSCNQDLLNIPQKGVIAYEDFYKTDEDAQSALLSAYARVIEIESALGGNTPSFNVMINAGGDELYWGGSKKEDNTEAQEINEFRSTYTNNNSYPKRIYNHLYSIIYRANLVIDNFAGELADTPVKKQCVAEARAIRAWSHFYLAIMFYNPPLVDHVLKGDDRPTNCDHQQLMDWVESEFAAIVNEIPARQGPNDKKGAVRFTKGGVQSYLGKVQIYNKKYDAAKATLKEVINSGNYALVPSSQLADLFHSVSDGCCEKVFELNVVDNENLSSYSGKYHFQRNQSLFLRQFKNFPDQTLQVVGWGNNMGPTEKFVNAMLENEPNSARRKAWFVSYEELLTDFPYSMLDVKKDGTTMTKEEKLMDPNRGLELKKYNDLYANCGYFWTKFLPAKSDLIHNNTTVTDENRCMMRYADVLLLYAEACAMTNDNDGLKYLNMVQERAEAPLSTSLTIDAVKKERWFELAWEGQRFFDLVRWGDAAKELAFKGTTDTPYLTDDFYEYGTLGKTQTGRPHKAVILHKDDGWKSKGAGFKTGHHEYFPIPFSALEVNDALNQNPYWAD